MWVLQNTEHLGSTAEHQGSTAEHLGSAVVFSGWFWTLWRSCVNKDPGSVPPLTRSSCFQQNLAAKPSLRTRVLVRVVLEEFIFVGFCEEKFIFEIGTHF